MNFRVFNNVLIASFLTSYLSFIFQVLLFFSKTILLPFLSLKKTLFIEVILSIENFFSYSFLAFLL